MCLPAPASQAVHRKLHSVNVRRVFPDALLASIFISSVLPTMHKHNLINYIGMKNHHSTHKML